MVLRNVHYTDKYVTGVCHITNVNQLLVMQLPCADDKNYCKIPMSSLVCCKTWSFYDRREMFLGGEKKGMYLAFNILIWKFRLCLQRCLKKGNFFLRKKMG